MPTTERIFFVFCSWICAYSKKKNCTLKIRFAKEEIRKKHTIHEGQMDGLLSSLMHYVIWVSPYLFLIDCSSPRGTQLSSIAELILLRTGLEDSFLRFTLLCFITCHLSPLFLDARVQISCLSQPSLWIDCKFLEGTAMLTADVLPCPASASSSANNTLVTRVNLLSHFVAG